LNPLSPGEPLPAAAQELSLPSQPVSLRRRLQINTTANLVGRLLTGSLGLWFIPLYVRYLGVAWYGLVGVYASLQSLLSLLDFGLGANLNREFARREGMATAQRGQEMRDLLRTFERVYWVVGLASAASIVVAAPWLARDWLRLDGMPIDRVTGVLRLMGLAFVLQWPAQLYQGGLAGLERQVTANWIVVLTSAVRSFGMLAVLAWVSPTIEAFFVWSAIASLIQTLAPRIALAGALPPGTRRPRWSQVAIESTWRFSAGLTALQLSGIILTQVDKVVLSRLLSLAEFGYYTLASVPANALYFLITPIYGAIFPRLCALVAAPDQTQTARLYHAGSQALAVLVLPAALVLSLFSSEAVLAWTGDPGSASKIHVVVSVLVIGTALNGLLYMPHALQLAAAWVRLGLIMNLASCCLLVPLVTGLALRYGAVGAASGWLMLNSASLVVGIRLTHRKLLPGETRHWLTFDLLLPLLCAASVIVTARVLVPSQLDRLHCVIVLAIVSPLALGAACLGAPEMRREAVRLWHARLARTRAAAT